VKYKLELILFFSLSAIVAALGSWQGQYNSALAWDPDKNYSLFLVSATIAWIITAIILKRELKLNFPFKTTLFFLLLNLFVICFFRDDISKSFRNFVSIFLTYGIIFFLSALINSIKLKNALVVINLTLLLVVVLSGYIHATRVAPLTFFAHDNITARMGGLFPFSHIGLMAGFSIVLSLILLWLKPAKSEFFLNLIQITIMTIAIALTDTRSAIIAAFAAGCLIVLPRLKDLKQRLSAIFSIIIIVPIGYFAYSTYIVNSTGEQTIVQSLDYRVGIWKMAIRGIGNRPFSGYGSESYLSETIEAASYSPGLSDPHSAIIGLALQSGIFASLLFLILYAKISAKAIVSNPKMFSAVSVYWAVAPFFWGDTYLQTIGFIQIIFGISFIGILLHSDLYAKKQIEPT